MNNSSSTARRSAATLRRPAGGETPRWRGSSTTGPGCGRGRWWCWRSRWGEDVVAFVGLAEREVSVCEHHERQVAMESWPAAPLVGVESQFALGVLVEAFDDPPDMHQFQELGERAPVHMPRVVILGLTRVAGEGPLPDEPAVACVFPSALGRTIDPHTCTLLDECALGARRHATVFHALGASLASRVGASTLGSLVAMVGLFRGRPCP